MKKLFISFTNLFIILAFVLQPIGNAHIAQAQAGAIGGAIIQCTGLANMISGAINSLFGGLFEVPATQSKETCLDAIGYALARTLLAKFTDATINWINSGFEGKPLYVDDFDSFFLDEIKRELELGLEDVKNSTTIYFDLIKQQRILEFRQNLRDRLGYNLDADIIKGICTYDQPELDEFCNQQFTPESRRELVDSYLEGQIAGRDVGWDWNFWLSMTQNCGNNPFCAISAAREESNRAIQEEIQQTNNELNRGSGFLGVRECKDASYTQRLQNWTDEIAEASSTGDIGSIDDTTEGAGFPPRPQCRRYGVTTPGSIVADKIKMNLGNSEQQLLLADELNESISAIFDALFNKLLEKGLSSFRGKNTDIDDPYYSIDLDGSGFGGESTIGVIAQDEETCEILGGTYDQELEICELPEENNVGYPDFPWIIEALSITVAGQTIPVIEETRIEDANDFSTFINEHPGRCVEIDSTPIVAEGEEPCFIGISENGNDDGGSGITPASQGTAILTPNTAGPNSRATITISDARPNLQFEILINGESVTFGTTSSSGEAVEQITLPADYADNLPNIDPELARNVVLFEDESIVVITK